MQWSLRRQSVVAVIVVVVSIVGWLLPIPGTPELHYCCFCRREMTYDVKPLGLLQHRASRHHRCRRHLRLNGQCNFSADVDKVFCFFSSYFVSFIFLQLCDSTRGVRRSTAGYYQCSAARLIKWRPLRTTWWAVNLATEVFYYEENYDNIFVRLFSLRREQLLEWGISSVCD